MGVTMMTVTTTAIINRTALRTGPTIAPGPGSGEEEREEGAFAKWLDS